MLVGIGFNLLPKASVCGHKLMRVGIRFSLLPKASACGHKLMRVAKGFNLLPWASISCHTCCYRHLFGATVHCNGNNHTSVNQNLQLKVGRRKNVNLCQCYCV